MIHLLIHIISVLFIQSVLVSDTTIGFDKHTNFKGQIVVINGDTLYKGKTLDNHLNKTIGYWDSDKRERYVFSELGPSESCYIIADYNESSLPVYYFEKLELNEDLKKSQWQSYLINKNSSWVYYKSYTPKKQQWIINKHLADYQIGSQYTKKALYDEKWDRDDLTFDFLITLVLFICGVCMLLRPITGKYFLLLSEKTSWIIGVTLVVAFCFLGAFARKQTMTPVFAFLCVYLLCKLLKNRKLRRIIRLLLCIIIMIGGECYQFLCINETVLLGDGTQVQLHWKRGTDVLKRFYIKRMVNNMVPIKVHTESDADYTIYMNKYEFSLRDRAYIIDDYFAYLARKRPLSGIAFRDAMLLTEKLSEVSGLEFDIPRIDEWQSAIKNDSLYNQASWSEEKKVTDGEPNEYGLVHLTSNVSEYTSSYSNSKYCLGLSSDTLVKTYDYVFVYGLAILNSTDNVYCTILNNRSLLYSVINKNFGVGNVGFRLIYRPNDIGKREFFIKGVLRRDKSDSNFPTEIVLLALNGDSIKNIPNYETFQERLIESRFCKKEMDVMNLATCEIVHLSAPIGYEYYDFVPEFSFKGLNSTNNILLLSLKEFEALLESANSAKTDSVFSKWKNLKD